LDESNNDIKGILPCGHTYCHNCIIDWGKVNNHCPLCKKKFNHVLKAKKNKTTGVTYFETTLVKDVTAPLIPPVPVDNCKF
jgi:predicted amidophosphoribosyltransferase